jgi:methylphosphotriester-DNA--protein-cysteine methyltransferase
VIGDAIKYDRIEQATRHLQAADQALRRLAVELADVGIGPTRGVEITQMTRTFDIWFDNIFSDWAVRNRIEEAAQRLTDSRRALVAVQQELAQRQETARRRHHELVADRELVIDTLTAG